MRQGIFLSMVCFTIAFILWASSGFQNLFVVLSSLPSECWGPTINPVCYNHGYVPSSMLEAQLNFWLFNLICTIIAITMIMMIIQTYRHGKYIG